MTTPGRILVVDDDDDVRDMLDLALSSEGYRTLTARNGVEALAWLRQPPPPDLILLDLRMPRMDGFELMRTLERERLCRETPIVVLTGDAAAGATARSAGANACLSKPLDIEEIFATVKRFVSRAGGLAA